MIVIIMAAIPIPTVVVVPIVMIVSMGIFAVAVISTAFFDGTPGCYQQTGQGE